MKHSARMFYLWLLLATCVSPLSFAQSQDQNKEAPADSGTVIRKETRLVLVDAIVTEKNGKYVPDLTAADFRVLEDGKEQKVKSFSFEAALSPENRRKYIVVLLDESSMNASQVVRARAATLEFIGASEGTTSFIAVARFSGGLQIAQNFTRDGERLKAAVSGNKVVSAGNVIGQGLSLRENFGSRSLLLALRSLAKDMASTPGRKALVLLSTGFPITSGNTSELVATIDACNRSNVAIYGIDVTGLTALVGSSSENDRGGIGTPTLMPATARYSAGMPTYSLVSANSANVVMAFQRTPAPPGGGQGPPSRPPGRPGGGNPPSTGRSGGRESTRDSGYAPPPPEPPKYTKPWFGEASNFTNNQVLRALAEGTGGFVVVNSNGLADALSKVRQEQDQYYLLGYTPEPSNIGTCHTLKVQVRRNGVVTRARAGYCNVAQQDMLADTAEGKQLEKLASESRPVSTNASMSAPFFYISNKTARVNVALEIPPEMLKVSKEKGITHAEMNVLGTAVKADGSVAARFSDAVRVDLKSDEDVKQFKRRLFHYEKQFDIACGQYDLTVLFSTGNGGFGRLQSTLSIEPYNSDEFGVSAIAFSKQLQKATDVGFQQALLDYVPLLSHGVQFIPSGTNRFEKSDAIFLYVEIYDPPLSGPNPPKVAIQYVVANRNTEEIVLNTGLVATEQLIQSGSDVIAAGLKLPIDSLPAGSYHLELRASDSKGRSKIRVTDFEIR